MIRDTATPTALLWALVAVLVVGCATKRERPAPPPPEPECRRLNRASGVYEEVACQGRDADQDGIDDAADLCPEAPETPNGEDDLDGCPDPDADGDQVRDEEDDCPHQAGAPPIGCPVVDADGDGLADHIDSCPDSREDFNGIDDQDGCPDGADVLVVARRDNIYIKQPIHFLKKSAMLLPDSKTMLDRMADQLKPHQGRIARIRVVGHADRGEVPKKKLEPLSKTRARIVARYLIYQGLDKSLFETESRAAKQPASRRRTKRDREKNQRVELLVTLLAPVATAEAGAGGTEPAAGSPAEATSGGGASEPGTGSEPTTATAAAGAETTAAATSGTAAEPGATGAQTEPGETAAKGTQPEQPAAASPEAIGEVEPYVEDEEWDSDFLDDDWDSKFLEK